jgi:transposase
MLLTEGPTSDYKGAALVLDALPKAQELIADRGYDADWFRSRHPACIPSKSSRKIAIPHDVALHRHRHKIEIMFGRLKDWPASTPAMTDAPTRSSRPYGSPPPSSSGSDQRVDVLPRPRSATDSSPKGAVA